MGHSKRRFVTHALKFFNGGTRKQGNPQLQWARALKHRYKSLQYAAVGLNGRRAVARRLRQIGERQ